MWDLEIRFYGSGLKNIKLRIGNVGPGVWNAGSMVWVLNLFRGGSLQLQTLGFKCLGFRIRALSGTLESY